MTAYRKYRVSGNLRRWRRIILDDMRESRIETYVSSHSIKTYQLFHVAQNSAIRLARE